MARNHKDFTFDYALQLKDAGLVAADAAATVGGSAQVLDLGDSRFEGRIVADVTAIEIDNSDEAFLVIAQFSDSATFASGVVNGPVLLFGDETVVKSTAATAVGRYEVGFANEINGTLYRYMRLYTECQGTVGTGINYDAFVVQP